MGFDFVRHSLVNSDSTCQCLYLYETLAQGNQHVRDNNRLSLDYIFYLMG